MSLLAYRTVVSCDRALLPVPGGGTASMLLLHDIRFRGVAFHPDEPWLAICQFTGIDNTDSAEPSKIMAVAMSPDRLRNIAAKMIAIADELQIKPCAVGAKSTLNAVGTKSTLNAGATK